METIFNILRNIFAVIGLVLSIALVIVLCSDEFASIWNDYRRLGFDSRADLMYILEKISGCN